MMLPVQIKAAVARRSTEEEQARGQQDVELWRKWRDGGEQQQDAAALFSQFRGKLHSSYRQWEGKIEVPPVVVRSEFDRNFFNALQTYDPDRGPLGPWIGVNLQKGSRALKRYQNVGYIPEARTGNAIQQYKDAKERLDQRFGREPTVLELADELKSNAGNVEWTAKMVATLGTELRSTNLASMSKGDPFSSAPSREKEVLDLIRYELDPEELQVYEYTVGIAGKPQLRPGEIAQKLGIQASKVSRIRNKIAKLYKDYQ